jgi:RepB plasmid partitioning protein
LQADRAVRGSLHIGSHGLAIRQKRDILDGICGEAVQLLRDKRISAAALRELRKVQAMRQIEIAELMSAANNYTIGYMKCLVLGTADEQKADGFRGLASDEMSPGDITRIERESHQLVRELKGIEESHGKNVLNLVIVTGYLRKLLDNARVLRFLSGNYSEILSELQSIVDAGSLQAELADPKADS